MNKNFKNIYTHNTCKWFSYHVYSGRKCSLVLDKIQGTEFTIWFVKGNSMLIGQPGKLQIKELYYVRNHTALSNLHSETLNRLETKI